jgi:hypothetical protein
MKWKGRRQSTNVVENDTSLGAVLSKMAGAAFGMRQDPSANQPYVTSEEFGNKGEWGKLAKSQGDAIERMGAEARRNPKPRIPRRKREKQFAKGGKVLSSGRHVDYSKS